MRHSELSRIRRTMMGAILCAASCATPPDEAATAKPAPGAALSTLNAWNTVGDANWTAKDGVIQADTGKGFLVSKKSFDDFDLAVEFWAAKASNSGVFLRCSDPGNITDKNCYEVNIFDSRPDQSGRTGGIVNVAPPQALIDSEGRWNTFEISIEGPHIVVKLNGTVTVDIQDKKLQQGPVALQFIQGGIKFKNIVLRPRA